MKLRLAAPAHLVDLAGIADLKGIRADGGDIVIGAMVTQHEVIASELLATKVPILRETSLQIADPQVRYRRHDRRQCRERRSRQRHAGGDDGARRDLSARRKGRRAAGSRRASFYQGAYVTALQPGEILTAIRIPAPPAGHGYAYEKLKRKIGDYATAAAAVVLTMEGGKVDSLRHRPHQRRPTRRSSPRRRRAILVGSTLDAATVKRAVAAAEAITSPASDRRGTPQYRTKMAGVMLVARARPRQIARA